MDPEGFDVVMLNLVKQLLDAGGSDPPLTLWCDGVVLLGGDGFISLWSSLPPKKASCCV